MNKVERMSRQDRERLLALVLKEFQIRERKSFYPPRYLYPIHRIESLGYNSLEEALRDAMDIPEEIR